MPLKNYYTYLKVIPTIILLLFSLSMNSQSWKTQEEFDLYMDSLDLEIQSVRYTDLDKTKELTQKFYDLSQQMNDTLKMAYALNFFSVIERDLGNYDEAITYGEKAVKFYLKANFMNGAGGAYNNLANINKIQGDYKSAFANYNKAVEIFKQENYQQGVATVTQNYVELLIKHQKFEEAAVELEKLEAFYQVNPFPVGEGFMKNAQANLLTSQNKEPEIALLLLEESIKILRTEGREKNALKVTIQLVTQLIDMNKISVAEDTLENVLPNLKNMKLYKEEALGLYYLAKIKFDKQGYVESGKLCKSALEILTDTEDMIVKSKVLKLFHQIKFTNGEHKEAYLYLTEYKKIEDSLKAIEDKIAFENVYALYDNLQKQEEINKLTYQTELQDAETKSLSLKNRNQTYILIGTIVFLLLATVFVVLYVTRYRSEKSLTIELKESVKERDMLNSEIHHRVKNNLQIISSLLDLQIDSNNENKVKEALTESQTRIQSMAFIHENLYKSGNLKDLKLDEYIHKIVQYFIQTYSLDSKGIQVKIDMPNVFVNPDKVVSLGLIINECFTNTLKHAFEYETQNSGNLISIRGKVEDNLFEFRFEDNGKGFDINNKDKYQNSLGINLIKGLSNQLKGKVDFLNEKGLKIIIKFNVS